MVLEEHAAFSGLYVLGGEFMSPGPREKAHHVSAVDLLYRLSFCKHEDQSLQLLGLSV